jgi:hypothetical protein
MCRSVCNKIYIILTLRQFFVLLCEKFSLEQATKAQIGSRAIALLFLRPRRKMVVGDQRHAPAALPPGKRPSTHCTGGWVGPRTGLDRCWKSRPPPGFDPQTVHPVASRYTDWAIPARALIWIALKSMKISVTRYIYHLRSFGAVTVTRVRWNMINEPLVLHVLEYISQQLCSS